MIHTKQWNQHLSGRQQQQPPQKQQTVPKLQKQQPEEQDRVSQHLSKDRRLVGLSMSRTVVGAEMTNASVKCRQRRREMCGGSLPRLPSVTTWSSVLRAGSIAVPDLTNDKDPSMLSGYGSSRHLLLPTCLLGGTAVAYAHLFFLSQSPSAQMSPMGAVYMMLLAIQYAIVPKLSRRYIRRETSKVRMALTEEVVKSTLALSLFVATNRPAAIAQTIRDWNIVRSLYLAGVPAVLYALQGVLQYESHQYLDAVTYNGLQQTKTLSSALFCFLLLHKAQSGPQVVALLVLFASSMLFQQPGTTVKKQQSSASTGTKFVLSQRFYKGVIPCVGATLISGLAGALSQYGLQRQRMSANGGITRTDPFLYALEVSFYSALTLLLVPGPKSGPESVKSHPTSQTTSWRRKLWIKDYQEELLMLLPTACKAVGGILTVLVHQHAGTVSKGFAMTFGLVISACLHTTTSDGRSAMTLQQVIGTIMVVVATWLHQKTA